MENSAPALPVSGSSSTPSSPVQSAPPANQAQGTPPSGKQTINQKAGIGSSPEPALATPPPKIEEEFFEVKADKKMHKFTRQQMIDLASKGLVADSRFDEAANTKKRVDTIIKNAKENPIQALMDPALGLSKEQVRDAFESWYHDEFIVQDQLTPEQKEHRKTQAELKRYQEQEQETQRRLYEEKTNTVTEQHRQRIVAELTSAFDQSDLPKTPALMARAAFFMQQNKMRGFNAPMEAVVRQVENEQAQLMQQRIASSSVEQLYKFIGPEMMKKIRMHDLQTLKESRQRLTQPFSDNPGQVQEKNDEKVTYNDVNKRLNLMSRGIL